MLKSRVTSKGQITLPAALRRVLNIMPGDDLLFSVVEKGEVKVRVQKRKRLTEFYAVLPASRPYPGKPRIREEVARELGDNLPSRECGK